MSIEKNDMGVLKRGVFFFFFWIYKLKRRKKVAESFIFEFGKKFLGEIKHWS